MMTLSVHGKRRHAFTLLELMIVVVVLGILMGLLLPAFLKINERARTQRARLAVAALATAIRTYHTRHGEWPAAWREFDGENDHRYGELRHDHGRPNGEVAFLLFNPPDGGPPLLERKHFEMDGDNLLNPFRNLPDDQRQYSIWMDMNYDGEPSGGLRYWIRPQIREEDDD